MAHSGRRHLWRVLLAIGAIAAGGATEADAQVVRVTDYGAEPGSRRNAVAAVGRALEACRGLARPVLVFPRGRYDFWPQHAVEKVYFESNTTAVNPKRLAIFIDAFAGLTVDGGGSTFVFHDRMQPFTVDRSTGVTIRDLSIDWDIPLSAEAVVEAATEEHLDLRIDDRQFPYVVENDRVVFVGEGWKSGWWDAMEFDGRTLQVVPGTGDAGCLGRGFKEHRAEALAPGRVRLHRRFGRRPAVDNVLVLRHGERDHAGVFVVDSKDVTVENVDLFHCAGLGVLAQFTENLTVRGLRAVPSPARRVLSGHDDGVHVSNCRGLVLIEGSRFHGLMDDPVNIHGTSVRIVGRPAPDRLLCRFMHEQSTGMTWGR
ncbi:MAG TPA: alpha-1,3-galactosidase B, partial [Vicinamibacteria bacterium]|nr:alpha-1,3-galactosidase B [Vicinamibacteria bacterium]